MRILMMKLIIIAEIRSNMGMEHRESKTKEEHQTSHYNI